MPGYEVHRLKPSRLTLRILRLLLAAPAPWTPFGLARKLAIGKPTLYRHVWAMQREGIPVKVWRREKGKGYHYVLDRMAFWEWCGGNGRELPERRANARRTL